MSYRLFGAESSAYSTKMRSYLAYKGVAFDWLPRTKAREEELKTFSRFPTLPVLVTASGFAVHDTTPMMEALEADSPEPSATPADPAMAFLACVLEEYADVWLAKAAFHYRWTRKKDQRLAAQRSIDDYYDGEQPDDRKAQEDLAIENMLTQMRLIGLEGELGAVVEKSFKRLVKLLDNHLRKHLFIFGGRPSIADFAIAGQLIQMMKDPTPAKIIEKDGEFVAKETLAPLFQDELSAAFLPWAAENLENSLAGAETFEVTLGKEAFQLAPLRSAARSFRELRRKFVAGQTIETLKAFTDETASTAYLLRPPRPEHQPRPPRDETRTDGETASDDADSEAGAEEGADAAAAPQPGDEGEGTRRRRRRRRRGRGRGEGTGTEVSSGEASGDPSAEEASFSSDEPSDAGDAEAGDSEAGDADASGDSED
jgi:glutathione S-transferase